MQAHRPVAHHAMPGVVERDADRGLHDRGRLALRERPRRAGTTVDRFGSAGWTLSGATTTVFVELNVSPLVSVSVTVAVYVPAAA